MSSIMSWLSKLPSDDIGTLMVKGTVVFLVIGSGYLLLGDRSSQSTSVAPEQLAANLAPIGRVAVTPPPAPPAPAETAPAPEPTAAPDLCCGGPCC